MQKACFIVLFMAALLRSSGQNTDDSIPHINAEVFYCYPTHFLLDTQQRSPDTSLDFVSFPYPSTQRYVLNTGNLFTPQSSLLFDHDDCGEVPKALESVATLLADVDNLPVFSTNIPYTQLEYIAGMFNEQYVSAVHSRNFSESFNTTAFIKLLAADGAFPNQKNNMSSAALNASYSPEKGAYSFLIGTVFEKLKNQEYGGIASDSLFEDSAAISNLVDTRLSGPLNTVWHREVSFTQRWRLPGTSRPFYLFHRFAWNDYHRSYTDVNADTSAYYAELGIVTDSTDLFDSLLYQYTTNVIGIRTPMRKSYLSVWLTDSYKRTYRNLFDSSFNDLTVSAHLDFNFGKTTSELSLNYGLAGWDPGGLNAHYVLKSDGEKDLRAKLRLSYSVEKPDIIMDYYHSANLNWTHDWTDEKRLEAGAEMRYSPTKLILSLNYYHLEDFVYWDLSARPNQSSESIDLLHAALSSDIKWHHLHLVPELHWQHLTGAPVFFLPEWFARGHLFFENMLFHRHMLLRFGAAITWYSSFKAPAYNAVLMNYYLQNQLSVGNYPWIDAFLAVKIAQARIFLQTAHANANLNGRHYYSAPHYPTSPLTFRMGISWLFYE